MVVCTMPGCQSTAGCMCNRGITYTPVGQTFYCGPGSSLRTDWYCDRCKQYYEPRGRDFRCPGCLR